MRGTVQYATARAARQRARATTTTRKSAFSVTLGPLRLHALARVDSPAVALARSPDVDVHGVGTIRGFRYRDGARGVNLDAGQDDRRHDGNDFATVFPTPRCAPLPGISSSRDGSAWRSATRRRPPRTTCSSLPASTSSATGIGAARRKTTTVTPSSGRPVSGCRCLARQRFPLALQQASAYYPTTDTAGLSPA